MRLTISTLFLALVTMSYAQKNDPEAYTNDGFVVLKESPNDTIFGKVRERATDFGDHLNAWLMDGDGNIEKYKKKELVAVGRGNDLYIVKEKLPKGYQTQLLKVGVRGAITCYELHNNAGATFFLMKEGQEKAQIIRDAVKSTGKYMDHKRMRKYFEDDPVVYEKIKNDEYNPVMTPAAVREYNERHPHTGSGIH